MQYLTTQNIAAAIGVAYSVASFVAFVAPKGSKVGAIAARFAADLKGHLAPPVKP